MNSLAPGELVLVAKDIEALGALYDLRGLLVAGEYEGQLRNGADRLRLEGPFGETILDFTYVQNTGAAFSFLAGASGWQRWFFIVVNSVASIGLTIWLVRLPRGRRMLAIALAMIIGGAVGNLIDRVFHGYVIDFVHAHLHGAYFPAFNVADSSITIGAILLILGEFRRQP